VCEGKYFKTIGRLPKWYTLTEERTIVQMKQVVGTNVSLLPIAEGNMLPLILPTAVCREATIKGAMHLLNKVHLELQAKIVNLDLLEHADPEYAKFVGGEDQSSKEEDENDDKEGQEEEDSGSESQEV
jgi:hypothetical protein